MWGHYKARGGWFGTNQGSPCGSSRGMTTCAPRRLTGPPGTGKTPVALPVASELGRPVTLVHGDDEFASSDLVGNDYGYRKSKLVDNFIHSVLKTEEEMKTLWMDNRLHTACQE